MEIESPPRQITDFATGRRIPDIGAEGNRQALERHLVENKGYEKTDIEIDIPLELTVGGDPYRSKVDLAVRVGGVRFLVAKCAAGSLASREREVVAAARLLEDRQIPLAVSSDGKTAIVLETATGKKRGEGLDAIPSKAEAGEILAAGERRPYPEERLEREKLIYRTYDLENVNRTLP